MTKSVDGREPFSLIMLDLDDFKAVNDALGHQAGDRLLADIAKAIVAAGRDTDHVFRYGGDEFALILAGHRRGLGGRGRRARPGRRPGRRRTGLEVGRAGDRDQRLDRPGDVPARRPLAGVDPACR